MITNKNRFHGHNSVSKVRGKTVHSSVLSIRFAKNHNEDYRLAVVVSKKVHGSAVVRNRIRRRVYEVFRTQQKLEGIPIDVVVYVKSVSLASMPFSELEVEIENLAKKAKQNYLK